MQAVVILGAGGHAREVLGVLEALNAERPRFDVLGYIVESGHGEPGAKVDDRPILGDFDWLRGRDDRTRAICGVGSPELRRRLAGRAREAGVRFASAVHPSVVRTARVQLGEGVLIAAGAVLTSSIRVGDHVHVNTGCTINHDCVLEDYATLSPGVHLAGNVVVGEGAFVGIGACAIERCRIGAWSVVGAGATVLSDVPPGATAIGTPARTVKLRDG